MPRVGGEFRLLLSPSPTRLLSLLPFTVRQPPSNPWLSLTIAPSLLAPCSMVSTPHPPIPLNLLSQTFPGTCFLPILISLLQSLLSVSSHVPLQSGSVSGVPISVHGISSFHLINSRFQLPLRVSCPSLRIPTDTPSSWLLFLRMWIHLLASWSPCSWALLTVTCPLPAIHSETVVATALCLPCHSFVVNSQGPLPPMG